MPRKKQTKTCTQIETREQMESIVGQVTQTTISIDAMKAEMDQRITEIRKDYEGRLSAAEMELDDLMAVALDWAERNPDAFGASRSVEMTHAVVGFRTGMPSISMLRGWNQEKCLAVLPEEYVRTKREPNKEKLIADRDTLKEVGLARLGYKVSQAETFFVDPKRETPANAKQVA
jgi:phage host-nuclease inhibitor protein Gam